MSKLFFSFLLVLSSSALFECKQISTQAHEISKRMVGGNDVSVSDFQSLNSVVTISWYNMKCYGVLVASKWVLTSAQCLTDNVMGKNDPMNSQSMHMFNVSFGRTTTDQQVAQGLSKYNVSKIIQVFNRIDILIHHFFDHFYFYSI
jgi:secreted trypsin-like serine protease